MEKECWRSLPLRCYGRLLVCEDKKLFAFCMVEVWKLGDYYSRCVSWLRYWHCGTAAAGPWVVWENKEGLLQICMRVRR